MTPGAKIFLALSAVGVSLGVLVLAGTKKASAKPGAPPDVIVPPSDDNDELEALLSSVLGPAEIATAKQEFAKLQRGDAADAETLLSLLRGEVSDPTEYGRAAMGLASEGFPTLAKAVTIIGTRKFTPAPPVVAPPMPLPIPLPANPPPAGTPILVPAPGGGGAIVVPAPPPPAGTPNAAPVPAPPPPPIPTVVPVPAPAPPPAGPVTVPTPVGPVTLPPLVVQPAPQQPPPPVVIVPQPPPAAPPPPVVVAPPPQPGPVTTVTKQTAALVASLLDAETRPGWNTLSPLSGTWQADHPPLVVDQKVGPKTNLQIAQELGTLPLVRFWPKNSQKAAALADYRNKLLELAASIQATDPARAAQLRTSADRERAQSFGFAQGKAPAVPPALQVSLAKVS